MNADIISAGIAKLNVLATQGYPMTPREAGDLADAFAELRDEHDALLAACKAALGAFEHNHAIDWDDLRRAIEKAEGGRG